MVRRHSFTEYVGIKFYKQIFEALEEYINDNRERLDLHLKYIHYADDIEFLEFDVFNIRVSDAPGMRIDFNAILDVQINVTETDNRHGEKTELCCIPFLINCTGDISKNLDDFEILKIEQTGYHGKNKKDPMSDALVPIIGKDNLDSIAESFLREFYPKALLEPCYVDTMEVVKKMGLNIKLANITKEGSIFGRCYFKDSETDLYDPSTDSYYKEKIPKGTILVDKDVSFFRSLGAQNNTVIHECVHWWKHKKAFALANLYDDSLSSVGCEVKGGILGIDSEAMHWMEWQANALAPRIQMPKEMFKKAIDKTISDMRRETKEYDQIDIIEPVINQLSIEFGVSRTAVKLRLVDLGYDVAIGAFNYIDGHYVPPHKSSKSGLSRDVTFSIEPVDFAILSMVNRDLRNVLTSGRYQYVENHVVLLHPNYLEYDDTGSLRLTHYARNHMDECCILFHLEVEGGVKEKYVNEFYLNRDEESPIVFKVTYTGGLENSRDQAKKDRILEEYQRKERELYKSMTQDYTECLKIAQKWGNALAKKKNKDENTDVHDKLTYNEIAERAGISGKTVQRAFSKNESVDLLSIVLICLAMHLPYDVSKHIVEKAVGAFDVNDDDHMWLKYALEHMNYHKVSDTKEFLKSRLKNIEI